MSKIKSFYEILTESNSTPRKGRLFRGIAGKYEQNYNYDQNLTGGHNPFFNSGCYVTPAVNQAVGYAIMNSDDSHEVASILEFEVDANDENLETGDASGDYLEENLNDIKNGRDTDPWQFDFVLPNNYEPVKIHTISRDVIDKYGEDYLVENYKLPPDSGRKRFDYARAFLRCIKKQIESGDSLYLNIPDEEILEIANNYLGLPSSIKKDKLSESRILSFGEILREAKLQESRVSIDKVDRVRERGSFSYTDGLSIRRFWTTIRRLGDPALSNQNQQTNRTDSVTPIDTPFTPENNEGGDISWRDWLLNILSRFHRAGYRPQTIIKLRREFLAVFTDLLSDADRDAINQIPDNELINHLP